MNAKRKTRKPNPDTEARKESIEIAVKSIDDESPDFGLFMRRWGTRYGENNLRRLWVQAPNATCLHKFGTWQGMGRQVRKGEKAILLMQPRVRHDAEKITPANPEGAVFTGASWMALFDWAQTQSIDDFTEEAPPDVDADLLAEVKRLRKVAMALHPDVTGEDTEEMRVKFTKAWLAYEEARERLHK